MLLGKTRLAVFLALLQFEFSASTKVMAAHTVPHPAPSFQLTDELCFLNKDPDLAGQVPILGNMGVKKGVCQGMAAIVAAFQERAIFLPNTSRQSRKNQEEQLLRLFRDYRRNCPRKAKTKIFGFAHLQSLCQAYRTFFLKQSIWINADIATAEIASHLYDFVKNKGKAVHARSDLEDMARVLKNFESALRSGRKPLLMYYSHVVVVIKMETLVDEKWNRRVVLWVNDSNVRGLKKVEVPVDWTGMPLPGQRKIWDVTPSRGC